VPGLGPVTAAKMLESVDDLSAIRAIEPKRLEKMRKYSETGKSAPQKSAASTVSMPSPGSAPNQNPPSLEKRGRASPALTAWEAGSSR